MSPASSFTQPLIYKYALQSTSTSFQGTSYAVIATPEDMSEWIGTVSATLKFTVKDCDPTTGEPDSDEGYPDEYVLEDLEMTIADYVQRTMKANFGAAWEELVGTILYYSVVVHLLCIVLANVKVEIVFVNIIKLNFMNNKLSKQVNNLEKHTPKIHPNVIRVYHTILKIELS